MSPEDPRFEVAVRAGCSLFSGSSVLREADFDDLAQELRIHLLAYEGRAHISHAKRRAIDWWRQQYGRRNRNTGDFEVSGRYGYRRLELLAYGFWDTDDDHREEPTEGKGFSIAHLEARTPPPDLVIYWLDAQRLLPQLPERDRHLLLLRHLQDWNHAEIGELFGFSVSNSCYAIRVAENRLQELENGP